MKFQQSLRATTPHIASSCRKYSNSIKSLGTTKLPGVYDDSKISESDTNRSKIEEKERSLLDKNSGVVEIKGVLGNVDEDVIAANKEAHAAAMVEYRKDTKTLANWLDVSVLKIKGRLYPADNWVIPLENSLCIPFPTGTRVTTLTGDEKCLDDIAPGSDVRLVTFSFKQYGHTLAETWAQPFLESKLAKSIPVISICFVEYGFLSFVKGAFIKGLKNQVDSDRWERTGYVFGGVLEFATDLLLPNKFTGYAYLIDGQGHVRWRGIGHAQSEDLLAMQRCATVLLEEEKRRKETQH